MPVTHEPWLVVLSLIVAIQGAYVGLSLAVQVGGAAGLRRRLLLAGAAISLAVAIWTMHFVGMLAARLPFPVDYLVFPTLLSFLVCVHRGRRRGLRGQRRPADAASRLARCRLLHGRRHRHHALHRHDGAACERPYDPCTASRRRQRGDRHRGLGAGALAGGRTRRPAAAAAVGDARSASPSPACTTRPWPG